jgi:hypothetical protein
MTDMITNPDEIKAAVAKVAEGRLTLWNARLDLAISAGDSRRIDAILARHPAEAAAGGGCGCGCGCGGGSSELAQ